MPTHSCIEVDGIGPVTARACGEFDAYHGDRVFLTPDETKLHRFDGKGLAIKPRDGGVADGGSSVTIDVYEPDRIVRKDRYD